VQFYQPREVAVSLPEPDESKVARASEIKLFCFYAGHVLADLGRNYRSEELVKWVKRRAWPGASWKCEPLVWDSSSWGQRAIGEVTLVQPNGRKAKPRFEASLEHDTALSSSFFELRSQSDWRLKMRGMTFSGKYGYTQYAASFPALLHGLLVRRANDSDYEQMLLAATRTLSFAYTVGELRPPARWTGPASDAAHFGWDGTRPAFLTLLSLDRFSPVDLPGQLWIEEQLNAGRRSFDDIPDDELPFRDVPDD
jgi:hypothetical protein